MSRFQITQTTTTVDKQWTAYQSENMGRRVVTVVLDHSKPTEVQPFRCTVCGNIVFERSGDVASLVSGYYTHKAPKPGEALYIVQCQGTYLYENEYGDRKRRDCHARYQLC